MSSEERLLRFVLNRPEIRFCNQTEEDKALVVRVVCGRELELRLGYDLWEPQTTSQCVLSCGGRWLVDVEQSSDDVIRNLATDKQILYLL